jgi:hypothetical protein
LASQQGFRRPRQIGRPLADFIVPTLGKTLAARGFAAADIVLAWPQIIGKRLARVSEPIELKWPRGTKLGESEGRPQKAATLIIRVEGAHGLEIQHMTPVILERVNAYFGWRCAEKLVLSQGRVTRSRAEKPRPPRPDAEALAKARKSAAGIENEALRTALAGLGAEVFAKRSSRG